MWKSEIAVREVKSDIRSNDKVENIKKRKRPDG